MKLLGYKDRTIDNKVKLYLETFGAILIEGPKWCGKTGLVYIMQIVKFF